MATPQLPERSLKARPGLLKITMAEAQPPTVALNKPPARNDGWTTTAHAFLFALLALASLGLDRLYVALGALSLAGISFVVARAPPAEEPRKTVSGSQDDDDDKRPRWERRQHKTEAKKAKRRETRSAQTKTTRRELSEADARERVRKAEDLQKKRDAQVREREEALSRKRELKLQRDDELKRQKEEKNQKDRLKEQEKKRVRDRKLKDRREAAARAKASQDASLSAALTEKCRAYEASVAAYVALAAIALQADSFSKIADDALTSASGKKRSNKAKATAKKAREKAETSADAAQRKRDERNAAHTSAEAARRALAAYCSTQNLPPPLPLPSVSTTVQKRPALAPPDDILGLISRIRKHGGCVPDDSDDDDDVVPAGARVAPSDALSSDDDDLLSVEDE